MKQRKTPTNKGGIRFDRYHHRLRTGEAQRENGKYVYRWTDKQGKRHAIYGETLEELREREEKAVVDAHDGIKQDTNNVTVNDIYELWKGMKRGIKDSTMQNYIYMYDMFVQPSFGRKKLTKVKKSDVKQFYNRLIEERMVKISTLDGIHNILHQVFQVAEDDELIRINPTDGMMKELKQAYAGDSEKRKALTAEQEKLFLDFLKKTPKLSRWHSVFYVMAHTGMRVGELTALRWNDLSLENGTISVNHTLVYYNHRDERGCYYSINTPKTKAGERIIPMTEGVKAAFLAEKQYQEEAQLESRSHIDGYSNFVFLNRFGEVLNQSTLNRVIKRAVRDCNFRILEKGEKDPVLLPAFSCHVLRHTFATRLAESGVLPKTLQEVMGHADISTSMDIYVTLSDEAKKRDMAAFEKYLERSDTGNSITA